MIRRLLASWRTRAARRRLDQLVRATRDSYEVKRFRERRAAALKGVRTGDAK